MVAVAVYGLRYIVAVVYGLWFSNQGGVVEVVRGCVRIAVALSVCGVCTDWGSSGGVRIAVAGAAYRWLF